MIKRREIYKSFIPLAWIFLSGLFLFLPLTLGERLALPIGLDRLGHLLYRIAFWLVLPGRLLATVILPPSGHHFSDLHYAVASWAAPLLALLIWRIMQYRRRIYSAQTLKIAADPETNPETTPELNRLPRRQFLVNATKGSVGLFAAVGGYASLVEPERLHLREYEVAIRALPREFDGLQIAHVSDTHYGPYTSLSYLQSVVERVNQLKPDLILLTGDYVHRTPLAIEPGIGLLKELRPRLGMIAVLGNHDHWEGADACRAMFKKTAIPLIDNAHLYLTPDGLLNDAKAGATLCIAGVGDLWEGDVRLSDALWGIPDSIPRILLSHNPDVAESIPPEARIDLMLSGHTHGGQVSLPFIGAPFAPTAYGAKYLGGLCHGPQCRVIVSRGVGLAAFPIRFGVPSEIGRITLRIDA